jgi:hypothetical protein
MKTFLNSNFKDAVYVEKLNAFLTAIDAVSYPASGSFLDVTRFSRFAFLICVGTLNSTLVFKVQQATAINGSPKDVTGATTSVVAGDANKWHMIEVLTDNLDITNDYKFVTLTSTGAAGGDDYACVVFLGLAPNTEPVTQHANFVASVVVAG